MFGLLLQFGNVYCTVNGLRRMSDQRKLITVSYTIVPIKGTITTTSNVITTKEVLPKINPLGRCEVQLNSLDWREFLVELAAAGGPMNPSKICLTKFHGL